MSLTISFIILLTNLFSKTQITKTLDWLIEVFTTYGKTLNLHTATINLEFQPQLRIMNLNCLMVYIQF